MLALDQAAYDTLIARARDGRPDEVCGVLGGTYGRAQSRVASVHRVPNAADDPRRRYRLDPEAQYAAMTDVEATAQDVVGFYHSHPRGPAGPSETDLERATWPGYSYVIVSLGGEYPFVGSWRWTGEGFEQETLRLR